MMGNLCCHRTKNKRKIVLLLVGLDNAGKTAAAKGLAGEPPDSTVPTVGFSIVNLNYLKYAVKIFDLGGGANIRGIWHKYFVDAHGVIFVVDSSDIPRLDEAKQALNDILKHEKISGKPLLVLANKQDNEFALDEVDLIDKLDLESLVNKNECPTLVQSSCAGTTDQKMDPNIKRGYEWLLNYIIRNYETLNKRVEVDVERQKALEARQRQEKIERIHGAKEAELRRRQEEDAIESYSNYERKLNGQLKGEEEEVEETDLIVVPASDSPSELSADSSDSFPPIYHIHDEIEERPKSAVELVRKQLELNTHLNSNKKTPFLSRASNKTAPMNFYNLPRSAINNRNSPQNNNNKDNRRLKSAGDFETSGLHHQIVSYSNSNEVFWGEIVQVHSHAQHMQEHTFTPIKCRKENGGGDLASWAHKPLNGDINGISVIDVD